MLPPPPLLWLCCTASTTASSAQAITSLSAAQASVMLPSCSFCSPFSVMMRASTGKAVTLMQVPTKRSKLSLGMGMLPFMLCPFS